MQPTGRDLLHFLILSWVYDTMRPTGARANVPFVGRSPTLPIAGPTGPGLLETVFDGMGK